MKLKEKRDRGVMRMREIVDGAETADRELTAEERQEFDRLDAEVEQLDSDIERRSKLDKRGTADDDEPGSFHEEDDEQRAAELAADRKRLEQRMRDGDLSAEDIAKLTGGEHRGAPRTLAEYRQREFGQVAQDADEYRQAFYKMLTCGSPMRDVTDAEQRALSKATAAAGANLVPTTFERTLIELARDTGVMRELATVITSDTGEGILVPNEASHGVAAWIGENVAYPESDESFGQIALSAYKAGTLMRVSEELLTDAAFDLEGYIGRQYAMRIGILENTAYVLGDGTGKPTGVVTSAPTGRVGATGQTTAMTGNDVIELVHSVLRAYRRNGKFLANDATIKALRLIKDNNGQYLWSPGMTGGVPDTLFTYPILTDPDMPVMAANAKSLLFGDFSFYWIRDVRGIAIQRLNELYAANGQVGFKAYHRTDGKLVNTAAVKAYANSAT